MLMNKNIIYLDHNATTAMDADVAAAMLDCFQSDPGNPASQHRLGQRARRILDDAKERIALLLGARLSGHDADRLVITSGGTEANNLAIRGLLEGCSGNAVISGIEHPCIQEAADHVQSKGMAIRRVSADREGRVSPASVAERVDDETRLVSLMLANHETGVLQPIQEISPRCREAGALVHTDAAQAVGKIDVDFRGLGVDAMTISSHKFGGPAGVGALLIRENLPLRPILVGGQQQLGLRAGTESVGLVVGMQTALESSLQRLPERQSTWEAMRNQFESRLSSDLQDMVIHGRSKPRLPQTSCISFLGVDRQALLMALDMAGIACSTGSACASGSSERSPVLTDMGCPEDELSSALRFSFGIANAASDGELAADRIVNVVNNLRR